MKEMISEEDGSMSGASDIEKNHKRSREQNNQEGENVNAKRIKVESLPDFDDHNEDGILESGEDGQNNMDTLRGDSEAEEIDESSLSEINKEGIEGIITQNNRDDGTPRRLKVQTLPHFDDNDDEILESVDGQNIDALRGDSEADEIDNDSLSEMNENSDVSQNSISSSNNNNLLDRRKNNMDTLEDGQEEDQSKSPRAPVLIPESAQVLKDKIIENGRHVTRRGSVVTSGTNNRSVETNEEDSSGGSTKENKKQETVLQRFEKEISDLTTLLLLKEKEWNAVLRLVKLKEIALAQLQRRKDVDEILESTIPSDSGTDYIQKLLKQIVGESIKTGASEAHVRNSIIETEKEVIELGKQISNSRIHSTAGKSVETDTLSGSDSSQVDSFFMASNALKSLVNRNKATLMSHSIPTASAALPSSTTPGKVIGEGRQGPIVEVTSLIADYRSRAQNDSPVDKKPSMKQPLTPGSTPAFTPMNQSATISFTDVLTRLKKLSDKEKDSSCSTTTSTTSNSKTVTPASKVKGTGNTNSSNTSVSGKSSVGTTLAKLLSSNNAGTGSRNAEDTPTFSNKALTSSNLTNSDKNLSLANLLASAKSRDDPQKKKADNQTVPLCQGCNANKAQFVCAGCANQWYCSRECQVAAWDEHSEVCSG